MPSDFLPPFANAEVRRSYEALQRLLQRLEAMNYEEIALKTEIESLTKSNSLVADELRSSQSLVCCMSLE
jgi:hypothetical protein